MDTCTAVDVADGTIYCCTLNAGHDPADEHRSDYRGLGPDGVARDASHSWTATMPEAQP